MSVNEIDIQSSHLSFHLSQTSLHSMSQLPPLAKEMVEKSWQETGVRTLPLLADHNTPLKPNADWSCQLSITRTLAKFGHISVKKLTSELHPSRSATPTKIFLDEYFSGAWRGIAQDGPFLEADGGTSHSEVDVKVNWPCLRTAANPCSSPHIWSIPVKTTTLPGYVRSSKSNSNNKSKSSP